MTDAGLTAAPPTSVVICAYTEERWDDLAASVAALGRGPIVPLETILVIDHNPDLQERAERELPAAVTVANAGSRGLSGARNTGIATARGEVVAFLDDDAVPQAGWLAGLLVHYRDPSVMGVGGGADPVWPDQRPPWFPREFEWVVGCSWEGLPLGTTPVRNLIGCNMSFRREVFELAGGFSEGIGRVGRTPLGCEETELCIRLRQRRPASILLYDPAVRVDHRVSDDRLRWRYFRTRCYAEGLSKAAVAGLVGSKDALSEERAHTMKVLPRGVRTGLGDARRGDRGGLLRAGNIVAGLAWTSAGYARGRLARASVAAALAGGGGAATPPSTPPASDGTTVDGTTVDGSAA